MALDGLKKPRHVFIFVRGLLAGLMFAGLFWYGSSHEATVSDLTTVIAGTSFWLILGAEILDKIAGREDYAKLYGWAYGKLSGGRNSMLTGILSIILMSAIIFMATLYIVTGSITANLGSYSSATLLWAGLVATYITLPETGDNELLLWIWLGATIATKGQYLHQALLIPGLR